MTATRRLTRRAYANRDCRRSLRACRCPTVLALSGTRLVRGPEAFGHELRWRLARDAPELVGRAGRADVERMARLWARRIARGRGLEEDDLVELETLGLPNVGDVEATLPG